MRERHQPCRPVDLAPGVVGVMLHRLSGVQTHPHHEADRGVGAQLALRLDRGPGRARRRREGGAEAVSVGGEHVPAVTLDRVPHDRVVDSLGGRHLGRRLVPPAQGILDAGEQERHCSRRWADRHISTLCEGHGDPRHGNASSGRPSTRSDRDGVPLRASFRAGPGLRRSDRPYRVIYRMSVRR